MDTLTTPKHTPGPWHYEDGTKTIRSETTNYWIATMDSWDVAVDHGANAALIAAAPDLLAACNAALAYLDAEDSAGLVAEIAAAVAKAEGRTL